MFVDDVYRHLKRKKDGKGNSRIHKIMILNVKGVTIYKLSKDSKTTIFVTIILVEICKNRTYILIEITYMYFDLIPQ